MSLDGHVYNAFELASAKIQYFALDENDRIFIASYGKIFLYDSIFQHCPGVLRKNDRHHINNPTRMQIVLCSKNKVSGCVAGPMHFICLVSMI